MKLLRPQTRVPTGDQLGHGMDAVVTLVLFVVAGFFLDRWLGTTPVMMIVMTVLASVGLFAKFRYRYEERMVELERERAERTAGGRSAGARGPHEVAAAQTARRRTQAVTPAPEAGPADTVPNSTIPNSTTPNSTTPNETVPDRGDRTVSKGAASKGIGA